MIAVPGIRRPPLPVLVAVGLHLSLCSLAPNPARASLLTGGSCFEWDTLASAAAPAARENYSAIYDAPRQRMIVFGGSTTLATSPLGDTWSLSLGDTPTWSPLPVTARRHSHSAIFDPVRNRMIVFGGNSGYGLTNNLWALALDGDPIWTFIEIRGNLPPARSGHTAIYDAVRDRMIVFGGLQDGGLYSDQTWVLDLRLTPPSWHAMTPQGSPPPGMIAHVAVYDPVRHRMIVIPGVAQGQYIDTIWALYLDTDTWSELPAGGDPPPLAGWRSAAYDSANDRVLVYGGDSFDPNVYALDLAGTPTWSAVDVFGALPPPREKHRAVYDAANERMVVFGGTNSAYQSIRDPIAFRVLSNGTPVTITRDVPAGGSVAANPIGTCFPLGSTVTLTATPNLGYGFTGWSGDAQGTDNPLAVPVVAARNIVAHFTGYIVSTHSLPTDAGHVARDPHQATYAPGSLVTLTATAFPGYAFDHWSGDTSGTLNPIVVIANRRMSITANYVGYTIDVSAEPAGTGTIRRSPDRPRYEPGTEVTLTASPAPGYAFDRWGGDVSGLVNPVTVIADRTYAVVAHFAAIPPSCGAWTAIDTTGAPPPRRAGSSAFDPESRSLIVFGGASNYDVYLNDLWAWSAVSRTWSRLDASGTPPNPRDGANAVYDPVRDRFIVLGGNDGVRFLNDAWILSLSGGPHWASLAVTGDRPVGKFLTTAVYDPGGDRILLFGGYSLTGGDSSELWELRLSSTPAVWNQLVVAGPPPRRYGHHALYDPVRRRMLVFGGNQSTTVLHDLWSLDLAGVPQWREIAPSGALPAGRSNGFVGYDAARDRLLLFGGGDNTGLFNDTWALTLGRGPAWVDLSPYVGVAPAARSTPFAAFDSTGRQLVVFGGFGDGGDLGDAGRLPLDDAIALDVAVDSSGHGAVTRSPNRGCYSPGETATITAVAASGYRFAGWQGDAGGSANPLSLVMDGYRFVIAAFEPILTATVLARFDATPMAEGVELRWRFGTPEAVTAVAIERAASASGPWTPLTIESRDDAGTRVAIDHSATAGREYFYRLIATLSDGRNATFGPVSSSGAEFVAESAITRLTPNPSDGATQIQFAVARAGPVSLTIADVQGRIVSTLIRACERPGRYAAAWDGAVAGKRVAPGVYFVRLDTPDRTRMRRLAIVR